MGHLRHPGVCVLLLILIVLVLLLALQCREEGKITGGGTGASTAREDKACPGVLFHGSPRELDIIRPSPSRIVNDEPVVFGTPSRWLALVFSTQARSKDLDFGFVGKPYIAEMHEGAFDLLKKPGYIHVVPSDGFEVDPRVGMPQHEFVCKSKVAVAEVEKVPDVYSDLQRYPEIRFVPAAEREAFYKEKGIPLNPSPTLRTRPEPQ